MNGRSYPGVVPIETLGRYGTTGLYEITVPSDGTRTRTIQMFILFDERESVRQAAAFYVEMATVARGGGRDWTMSKSAQLRLTFRHEAPD